MICMGTPRSPPTSFSLSLSLWQVSARICALGAASAGGGAPQIRVEVHSINRIRPVSASAFALFSALRSALVM